MKHAVDVLESNGFDFMKFDFDSEYSAKNLLKAMEEYANQPLYAFLYNPMIHESGYITASIHRTRKGAEKAMEWHKHSEEMEWNELMGKDIKEFPFGTNQSWKVEEIEVQE